MLDSATNTCQISISSNLNNSLAMNEAIAITIGVIIIIVITGLIAWNIYIMTRIKKYTRVSLKKSEEHIDVHFND